MFKLVIEDDDGNKTVVPVIRDEITIGRKEGNTIRLTERNVSRNHAKLTKVDDAIFVEEMAARYGTKKNGEKIDGKSPFDLGDVVFIGDYRLTLEGEDGAVKAEPPAAAAAPSGPPAPGPPKKITTGGFSSQPTQITRREDIERPGQGTEIIPALPAKLVVISSNFAGQEFPLKKKEVVIGRADECDIIVDHRSVSQTHAKIVREVTGNYKIVDLNSKNGVKVSGEEYRAVHLKRGDVVELGHVRFRFVESGENYVFSPQHIIHGDGDFDDVVAPKSNTGKIIGAVLALFVVVGIVAAIALSGDDPKTDVAVNEPAKNNKTVKPKVEDKAAETGDSKLAPQLEKAESELDRGKPERAIAVLEMARDTLEPSAEDRKKIDELLSDARRERPLEEKFDDGKDDFEDEKFVEALRKFKEIPPEPPSRIYALMMKEDLPQQSIDKILGLAMAAMEEGKGKEAGRLIDEVLLFDAEDADALSMKEELQSMPTKPVAVVTNNGDRPKPKPRPRPQSTKLTEEESAERLASGGQALMKGNWKEVIKQCKPVRNGKCYRMMGVAYQKLGNKTKSCLYLKKSGKSSPDCD